MKLRIFWDVLPCSLLNVDRRFRGSAASIIRAMNAASIITLMMKAARTSETSVDIQLRTRQYIPEDLVNDMSIKCGKYQTIHF
jgi:hypothetical protein